MFTGKNVELYFDGMKVEPWDSSKASVDVSSDKPIAGTVVVELKEVPEGLVFIPKGEYAIMQLRLAKLDALEAGGVDNWVGYGDCFEDEDDE